MNLHENSLSVSRGETDQQTDMTMLIVAVQKIFANSLELTLT